MATATTYEAGLEVATGPPKGHDAPIYYQAAETPKYYVQTSNSNGQPPEKKKPWYKQKKWLAVAGIMALLVVAIVVVGGVLGPEASKAKSDPADSKGGGKTGDNTVGDSDTGPTSIKKGTKLAATGYWVGTDFGMQVFYETDNDNLAYSRFENVFDAWSIPTQLGKKAQVGTGMGACVFYNKPTQVVPPDRQTQFYYVGEDSALAGFNWQLSQDAAGLVDSIREANFQAGTQSQLACYWPTHVYQTGNGSLQGVIFDGAWETFPISASAGSRSQLAMLPLKSSHYSQTGLNNFTDTDFRIIYRADDGFLHAVDILDGDESSSVALPAAVDDEAGVAAFSVGREGGDSVDSWVVFQDGDGNIKYTEQVRGTTWSGIKTVFDGADKNTKIACVTPGTSSNADGPVLLKTSHAMSMCFFQKDGLLKQMKFDGVEWKDLGNVPIA